MQSNILIIIPARYSSSRLPGKPLRKIAGIEMIKRTANIAKYVCKKHQNCRYVVATDNDNIINFCKQEDINVVMTSELCNSGTERCWDVVKNSSDKPDLIINLQGDNPLCPPWFIEGLIEAFQSDKKGQVFTPYVHLQWDELDSFYAKKQVSPFSGTTVLIDKYGFAITFSKLPLPAIRNADKMKRKFKLSPVRRHIGLYAYTYKALLEYFQIEPGQYEEAEELEQMRFIEHRIPVKMVEVDYRGMTGMNGVDNETDLARAEEIIHSYGEFDLQ